MNFIKLLPLVVMISWSSSAGFAEIPPARAAPYEKQVKALLNSLRDVTGVPAYSVAVVHKGALVASVADGYADREKGVSATPDHLFRLASVSKIIGATMLADLVEAGLLDPDAPLGSFYPELDTRYHQITVRQLMAHTSGMPHYQARDHDIHDEHYSSAMDAVKTLKGRSLLTQPGHAYHYSSHGYTLAGAVYEKLTGEPLNSSLPSYIERLTSRPTPVIEDITNLRPMSSKLYERSGSSYEYEEFDEKSYSVFGAGLSASAPDLALFGARVLAKSAASDSLRSLLFTPVRTADGGKTGSYLFEVGFGWRVGKDDEGRTVYHHAGVTPGARSVLVIYPEQDLSIAFLSNASWVSSIERTAFALADLYIKGAQPAETFMARGYEASFGEAPFSGRIECEDGKCRLIDGRSAFSEWLNRFNSTGDDLSAWPIFPFFSPEGMQLLLVSKIGFINMTRDGGALTAPVGRDRQVTITLTSNGH